MQGFIDQALSWLGAFCWGGFTTVAGFILSFFPDADPAIMSAIEDWGDVSGGSLTFNVLYFVDMQVVALFLGGALAVMFASALFTAVRITVETVHKILDSLPIIG